MLKNLLFAPSTRLLVRASRAQSGGAGTIPQHHVSAYDKFVLRVTGTVKQPVTEVSIEKMDKANSRFRIGIMFAMMALSIAGSGYAVFLGKRDAKENLTISQKNRDRHQNAKK